MVRFTGTGGWSSLGVLAPDVLWIDIVASDRGTDALLRDLYLQT